MAEKSGFRQISSASVDEQNMAQIREILFGEHNRETASELKALRDLVDEQLQSLRTLLDKRVTQAVEGLQHDLDKQGIRHQASLDGIDNALRALVQGLDEKINFVDSDLQDAQNAFKRSLAEQSAAHQQLQADSVKRANLADMLEQMATQLRASDHS